MRRYLRLILLTFLVIAVAFLFIGTVKAIIFGLIHFEVRIRALEVFRILTQIFKFTLHSPLSTLECLISTPKVKQSVKI